MSIKIDDNTSIGLPLRNLIGLIAAVVIGAWFAFGVIERLNALENQDTSHTHEVGEHTHEEHGHTKILVNEKTIQILQNQIDELKAKSDNPLAQ